MNAQAYSSVMPLLVSSYDQGGLNFVQSLSKQSGGLDCLMEGLLALATDYAQRPERALSLGDAQDRESSSENEQMSFPAPWVSRVVFLSQQLFAQDSGLASAALTCNCHDSQRERTHMCLSMGDTWVYYLLLCGKLLMQCYCSQLDGNDYSSLKQHNEMNRSLQFVWLRCKQLFEVRLLPDTHIATSNHRRH